MVQLTHQCNTGELPPTTRAIAHLILVPLHACRLRAPACGSGSEAFVRAVLCLRSPDLRHLLFRIDAGVTAVTTPRSFGSEAFPCVASKCHALRRSVGTNMGWRAVAYFCYPELILDGLVVILDSIRTYCSR